MDRQQLAVGELLGDDRLGDDDVVITTVDPLHQLAADVSEGIEHHRSAGLRALLPAHLEEPVVGVGKADAGELELALGKEVHRKRLSLLEELVSLVGAPHGGDDQAGFERRLGQPGGGVEKGFGLGPHPNEVETVRN